MADQSFSSFADLKEFHAKLRHQEAQMAQAKADAIEVKAGTEHLNPLKRKAQAAQAALNSEQGAAESARDRATPQVSSAQSERAPQAARTPPLPGRRFLICRNIGGRARPFAGVRHGVSVTARRVRRFKCGALYGASGTARFSFFAKALRGCPFPCYTEGGNKGKRRRT